MRKRSKKLAALFVTAAVVAGVLSGCGSSSAPASEPASEPAESAAVESAVESEAASEETESAEDIAYPERAISNVIPFAAGGGVDTWNRAVMAEMANSLGVTITSSNMTGGSAGSVGVQYGWEAEHDGYTIVGTSETPLTIPVMTGAEQTSEDWTYFIAGGSAGLLCVNKNCEAQTMEDIKQVLTDDPASLSIAGTQGGLWFALAKLFDSYANVPFNWVAYDGSGTAIKGCYGGETDAVVASAGELNEYIKSGDLIPVAVMNTEDYDYEGVGTIPAVTKTCPELEQYLPLQQMCGFMLPADTDPAVLAKLETAFHEAMQSDAVKEFAASNVSEIFDLAGEEAAPVVKDEESKLCWILDDMGQTKFSPEEFGIEKP